MLINIQNYNIDTEDINWIKINEKEVFIDTKEEFYRIEYSSEQEIKQLLTIQNLNETTKEDVKNAVILLITICEFFINTVNQCKLCPLKKKDGCTFTTIPINWKE